MYFSPPSASASKFKVNNVEKDVPVHTVGERKDDTSPMNEWCASLSIYLPLPEEVSFGSKWNWIIFVSVLNINFLWIIYTVHLLVNAFTSLHRTDCAVRAAVRLHSRLGHCEAAVEPMLAAASSLAAVVGVSSWSRVLAGRPACGWSLNNHRFNGTGRGWPACGWRFQDRRVNSGWRGCTRCVGHVIVTSVRWCLSCCRSNVVSGWLIWADPLLFY